MVKIHKVHRNKRKIPTNRIDTQIKHLQNRVSVVLITPYRGYAHYTCGNHPANQIVEFQVKVVILLFAHLVAKQQCVT